MTNMKIGAGALILTCVAMQAATAASTSVSIGVTTTGHTSSLASVYAGSDTLSASASGFSLSGSISGTGSLSAVLGSSSSVVHTTVTTTVNGQTLTQSFGWSVH